MSVVIETTIGDFTVDLFIKERPQAAINFLKLCRLKYYNYNLFHTIERGFIAQTGDPTGSREGGASIYGVVKGAAQRYFPAEKIPKIKHTRLGLLSFVGNSEGMIGSQFFITLGEDLTYLDTSHCVFGEVMEGLDVLEMLNETICDTSSRPYKDIRITHTVVLEDPFQDVPGMQVPERSPSPSAERLQGGRIAPDEEIDETENKSSTELSELLASKEAKARATILEMVGDIPEADIAPPENVLFVCKLNPVTTDDDLEIIFGRFGKIVSSEVIRDKKTGDSLQYAFVEFDNPKSCEDAYFKMDNVLIDDRRIHVDFSQSVARIKWHGKGRGITTYDDRGRKTGGGGGGDFGKGIYKRVDINRKPRKEKTSPVRSHKRERRTPERRKYEHSPRREDPDRRRRDERRERSRSRHRDDYESSRSRHSKRDADDSRHRDDYHKRKHHEYSTSKREHDRSEKSKRSAESYSRKDDVDSRSKRKDDRRSRK